MTTLRILVKRLTGVEPKAEPRDIYPLDGLGMSAEDAVEFFDEVAATFGTDFSRLQLNAFFPPDPEHFIYRIERLFGFSKTRFRSISLGDVKDAVIAGA